MSSGGAGGPAMGSGTNWRSRLGSNRMGLGAVTGPGTSALVVRGPGPASSPAFRVDAASGVSGRAMANALAFYQIQRDGPHFVPSPMRTAAGHLNDEHAMTYLTPKM